MAAPHDTLSMALFCDFENVALGVRDANFDKFDIKPILERLLLKGSIVVKKAYCDWDRYKTFKAAMHEANFELIEIPHVRQSGKNSADIRLVVDALDLCYTKAHVNTFVIISGDSDFSPLVSKLRENAKQVIGVGVRQSTSDLLIANCDEFIFYDDLVRETRRTEASREKNGKTPTAGKKQPDENKGNREELEARKSEAIEMAIDTFDALISERGDSGKIWASVLKNAIKRRKPDFNEGNYGFRTFGALLEEAQARGQLQLSRDDKSGTYVYRSNGQATPGNEVASEASTTAAAMPSAGNAVANPGHGSTNAPANGNVATEKPQREPRQNTRRNGRGNRNENRPATGMATSEEQLQHMAYTANMARADEGQDGGMTTDSTGTPATGVAANPAMESGARLPAESASRLTTGSVPVAAGDDAHATVGNIDERHPAHVQTDGTMPAGNPLTGEAVAGDATPREARHERGRRTQTGRRPVKPKNKAAPAHEIHALAAGPAAMPATVATPTAAPATATLPAEPATPARSSRTGGTPAAQAVEVSTPVSAPANEAPASAPDTPAAAKKRTARPARPRKPKAADTQD